MAITNANPPLTLHRLPEVKLDSTVGARSPQPDQRASAMCAGDSHSADPQMAMIEATYYSQQLSLGELSSLANEQKASNAAMKKIRDLQEKLRSFLTAGSQGGDKELTVDELESLKAAAAECGIDISASADKLIEMARGSDNHIWINDGQFKDRADLVSDIRESISTGLENVKGEASGRELELQRVTQELSTHIQTVSILSKRNSDTINAVIHNIA